MEMTTLDSINNNQRKKSISYCFLIIIIINVQINVVQAQFKYKQADRVQIIETQLVPMGNKLSSGSRDITVSYSKNFFNVTKITLSIVKYRSDSSNGGVSDGFKLEVVDVQKDKVTLRVTTNGMNIYNFDICILATDFPNSLHFIETNISGQSSKLYTAPGKILGYCAFFFGFKGNSSSSIEQRFDFNSAQQDEKTVRVSYDTTGVLTKNMNSVDYNVLIIYESDKFDSLLYSFIFAYGKNYIVKSITSREVNFQTELSSKDKIMYGSRYSYLKLMSTIKYQDIYLNMGNKNIKFSIVNSSKSIEDGEVAVFQLIMKVCPSNQFIILNNDKYECTSSCSSVNPKAFNDPAKVFPLQYDTYIMHACSYTCDISCYKCEDNSSTKCKNCKSNQFYDSVAFKCQGTKPDKYNCESRTVDSQTYQHCYLCNGSCKTCSGPLESNCLSCKNGQYFDSIYKKCSATQPEKYYCVNKIIDSSNFNYCYPCEGSCNTCYGPQESNCISCMTGQFYDSIYKKCSVTQPEKYYCVNKIIDSSNFKYCYPFHDTCKTCSGPQNTECTSCDSDIYYTFIKDD